MATWLVKLFRKKSHIVDNGEYHQLKQCLTAFDLTFLGVGAIIGAGIFVLTGIAAATRAGPAVILSFVLSGLACGFAALSYAELASSLGGCGSAYGYAYVGLGEFPAWIIGWDIILEYAMAVPAVSVGWSQYLNTILLSLNLHIPHSILSAPSEGGFVNLPAMLIIFSIAALLAVGVKSSARFNTSMVFIKLIVIVIFIIVAGMNVQPAYWHPFMPFGWSGVVSGAALVFFAYIGFDAVSTAAEEVIEPGRNLPIGIIASLALCTLLYIVVSGLLTSIVPYSTLNVGSPISSALLKLGYKFAAGTVSIGALAGLTTVILVMYYGLTRVFLAISRDRLLPLFFATLNDKTHTPVRIILISGTIMGLVAGFVPIKELAELVNIGTLAAFVMVCIGVIVLRYSQPEIHRPFKTPFSPLIPSLGVAFCSYLMISLPAMTWLRFIIWMIMGLVIYFYYGQQRSRLK